MDNTNQGNTNQQPLPSKQRTEQPHTSPSSSTPPKAFFILIVIILFMAVGVGGYFLGANQNPVAQNQPQQPTLISQPSPTPVDETANWKTYTYKNASFKYPSDWVVVFDSTVAGQTNGFSLHAQHKEAEDYQPDGLYISTYNDRASLAGDRGYKLSVDRKFTKTDSGDDYIHFVVNSTPIYAGCAFYSKGYDTIMICDQILSTFQFTN